MSGRRRLRVRPPGRALATVLRGSAVPYGYTLTVLASHSILARRHGQPDVYDIALFVAGALAGFATLAQLARLRAPGELEVTQTEMIGVGVANVIAIAVAFGGVALISLIDGKIAWVLGAYAATILYLSVATLEISVAERSTRRDEVARRLDD